MPQMDAVVIDAPGAPDVLQFRRMPIPNPPAGWVRIRIRGLGLNRAEMFTRQGHSPSVRFPRIIGIECVGEIDADDSGTFQKGEIVATMMGEMGRDFDGSYAQYTVVPASQILRVPKNSLSWAQLAAIPEMYQTATGALREMRRSPGMTFLIRGGTSSVGKTAIAVARSSGLTVLASSRRMEARADLEGMGAKFYCDTGELNSAIRQDYPDGIDGVLDLVGSSTLYDSMLCCRKGGVVSMTGILGNSWSFENWSPMGGIPSGVFLTSYHGLGMEPEDFQAVVRGVDEGSLPLYTDRVFRLDQMQEAHRRMENSEARGKMVVLPWPEDQKDAGL